MIDRPRSHIDEQVKALLPETLLQVSVTAEDQFVERTVTHDHVVGQSKVVTIQPGNIIFYAQRPRRDGLSKFVAQREPEDTTSVTVVLKKTDEQDTYVLITAYIGEKAGLEPWDRRATDQDMEYWRAHAFVEGATEYLPETRTVEPPEYFN